MFAAPPGEWPGVILRGCHVMALSAEPASSADPPGAGPGWRWLALAVAVLWVAIGLTIQAHFRHDSNLALRETANLAQILEAQVAGKIDAIDATLRFGQTLFARTPPVSASAPGRSSAATRRRSMPSWSARMASPAPTGTARWRSRSTCATGRIPPPIWRTPRRTGWRSAGPSGPFERPADHRLLPPAADRRGRLRRHHDPGGGRGAVLPALPFAQPARRPHPAGRPGWADPRLGAGAGWWRGRGPTAACRRLPAGALPPGHRAGHRIPPQRHR